MSKKNPPLSGWLGIALTHKILAKLGIACLMARKILARLCHER